MFTTDEETKHRKKKDNGSKSKKRSNHKHVYEMVIMDHWIYPGFAWTKRCSICGRTQRIGYSQSVEGLIRPRDHKYISKQDFYTIEELKKKYPEVRIFKRVTKPDGKISFDDNDVEEI